MTTQRDRLAALLHESKCMADALSEGHPVLHSAGKASCGRLADRLLAAGVRLAPPSEGAPPPDALRRALDAIVAFEPEWIEPNLDNADCKECAERRKRNWPPSGLCETHYGVLAATERQNKRRSDSQSVAMKDIARAALAATPAEPPAQCGWDFQCNGTPGPNGFCAIHAHHDQNRVPAEPPALKCRECGEPITETEDGVVYHGECVAEPPAPGLTAKVLLGYLWEATGKKPGIRVRDLFSDDDPLVADVERMLATPAEPPAPPTGIGADGSIDPMWKAGFLAGLADERAATADRAPAEPPPDALRAALDAIEYGAATADHASILEGPDFARGARWAAETVRAALEAATPAEPPAPPTLDVERLRRIEHAARDVDGAWDSESEKDGAPILWYAEAGEVLADLRTALAEPRP